MLTRIERINPNVAKNQIVIVWAMHRFCNYDCSYCDTVNHSKEVDLIPYDKFVQITKNIRNTYKDKRIKFNMSGGEPFIHSKIVDILKMFKDEGIDYVSVTTNGSPPTKKYLEAEEYLDFIVFSWHFEYVNEQKLKDTLLALDKNKNVVSLMFLPGRLDKVKEMVDWFTKNDINFVLRRIRPLYTEDGNFNLPGSSGLNGVHMQHKNPYSYYSTEEHEYMESFSLASTEKLKNIRVTDSDGSTWTDNVNTLLKNRTNDFRGWTCNAGLESLRIDADGTVYRADCKFGGPIGNILTRVDLPSGPIICGKRWCNCASDIPLTKYRNV